MLASDISDWRSACGANWRGQLFTYAGFQATSIYADQEWD